MTNWKTTLGGTLLAAGGALQAIDEGWTRIVGAVLVAVGGFLAGVAAKDASNTK